MDRVGAALIPSSFPPIHRVGWPFIGAAAALTVVALWLFAPLGWILLIITGWCVSFFRDPERVSPVDDRWLVSPADGVICAIGRAVPPEELGVSSDPTVRISIFMSLFDVHVNRSPARARVSAVGYRAGSFINASLDKASVNNERASLALELLDGRQVVVVQIAGLLARRIVRWVEVGNLLHKGERFGMIRFGSRVDVYLPEGVVPMVREGQRMVAGETVLADLLLARSSTDAVGWSDRVTL